MGVAGAVVGGSVVSGLLGSHAAKKSAKASQRATEASVAEQQRQFDLVRSDTAGQRQLGNNAIDAISRLYGYGSGPAEQPLSFADWSRQNGGFGGGPIAGGGSMAGLYGRGINDRIAGGQAGYQKYLSGFKSGPQPSGPDMSVFFESPDYQFNLAEGQKAIDSSAVARGGLLSGQAVKAGQRYASGLASREYGSFVDRLFQQAGIGSTGIGASASAGANAANNISSAYMNNAANKSSAYMAGGQALNDAVQGGIGNYMLYKYLGS